MKHRITLSEEEIKTLAHVTRHFVDYVYGDDRPDHGLGILKQYREEASKHKLFDKRPEWLEALSTSMGVLNRKHRELMGKRFEEFIKKMNENI